MQIRRIVPDILSIDLEKSKKFYGEFLGLELNMDMGWILTYSSTSNPTAQVTIIKEEKPKAAKSNIMITMEVSDAKGAHDKAISAGYLITYPLTDESWGVRRFFVEDPNGVTINLMQHLP